MKKLYRNIPPKVQNFIKMASNYILFEEHYSIVPVGNENGQWELLDLISPNYLSFLTNITVESFNGGQFSLNVILAYSWEYNFVYASVFRSSKKYNTF